MIPILFFNRESAMMIFGGHWSKMNIIYKRGLARALIQYSHSMGIHVKGSEGMCSALVMAVYDPWGDPIIQMLLSKEEINLNLGMSCFHLYIHKQKNCNMFWFFLYLQSLKRKLNIYNIERMGKYSNQKHWLNFRL